MPLIIGCETKDRAPDPVTDIEGNIYRTIQIGEQVWMAENLKCTLLSDGTEIPCVADDSEWGDLTTSGYCWYNNDEAENKDTYGALYNYYTVSSDILCPDGWHVPSYGDWEEMRALLGDTATGGGKLKEKGTIQWSSPNTGADNSVGFTAVPSGIRYFEGTYNSASFFTSFWSSTESGIDKAWYLSLYYKDAVASINKTSKKDGFSVRCVKN